MKKIISLMLLALVFLLFNCRSENILINEDSSNASYITSELSTGKYHIKDVPDFNNFIKTEFSKTDLSYKLAKTFSDEKTVFVLVNMDKTSVSYSTILKNNGNNSFTVLIYTVNNDQPVALTAEYIPASENENYEMYNFTGTVQYKSLDNVDLGSAIFEEGMPKQSIASNNSSGKMSCVYETLVGAVRCKEALHHLPGEPGCLAQGDNMPYYTTTTIMKCFNDGTQNIIYNDGGYGGGGNPGDLPPPELFHALKNIPGYTALSGEIKSYIIGLYSLTADIEFAKFAANVFITNPTTTFTQFENWFLNGYSQNFHSQLGSLSVSELQEYVSVNQEIDASPYDEEFVKETNEAFVAFTSYADIETMTDAQIEYVLNNNCCAGLFIQSLIQEKIRTVGTNYLLLRKLYPSWSKGKVFWHAARETIHLFLDIAGAVPVIGEVCDITNGVIYTIEGDGLNATLSYAGAIPIAGWGATGAKLAIKTVAGGISLAVIKNVDGFYVVSRNQTLFRKVLGMVKGDGRIAHHIIPFALQTNPVIQKAMLSKNAFMINNALNGIPVSSAVHIGSHSNYDNIIKTYLNNWNSANPNATPDQAYNFAMFVIQKAKTAIQNNPNIKINDLIF